MDQIGRHEHFMIKFYNELTGKEISRIEQINSRALDVLVLMDYESLITPFLIWDLRAGMSRAGAAAKYQVGEGWVRTFGEKFGLFPRKPVR